MIKSWHFIDNKFSSLLIASRPLSEYSQDSVDYFRNTNISTRFGNAVVFIKSNLVGFTPDIYKKILDASQKLPICYKMRDEPVLYISSSENDSNVPAEDVFSNIDDSLQIRNLQDILDLSVEDLWLINNAKIYAEYNAHIQQQLYAKATENEVYIMDKSTVSFAYDTVFGKNITIEPNVYFGTGVVIEDNISIKSFSYLEGVTIRNNATIGPFARIRPTSEIKQSAKVGNFVEIKNSTLGDKTKVGHLSYIGDSTLGNNVNVGAGVVTCNYDGQKKHKTIVGDNVFLGTNSSIVAPITIGHDSFIGAGSFINNNVPDGYFAVGRAKQQNKVNTKNK